MAQLRKSHLTKNDIHKLFKMEEAHKTIINAEERGEIPTAQRVMYGKTSVRKWDRSQLPEIGKRFGFLKRPTKKHVLCVYTPKGGVLKTSFTFNLARVLALHGIKTIIVGLDSQCSITDLTQGAQDVDDLADFSPKPGLFHFLKDNVPLNEIIQKTDLPTLDIIPETVELLSLENFIREKTKREEIIKSQLLPQLTEYQVVLFDTPPSWSLLIHNALTASNHVISPVGCDLQSYHALATNLSTLTEFQEAMNLKWDTFCLIPTLLTRTKVNQQIHRAYLQQYGDKVLNASIRRAVKGEEALATQQSTIEYNPTSLIAEDYYTVIQELWTQIIDSENS